MRLPHELSVLTSSMPDCEIIARSFVYDGLFLQAREA